MIVVKKSPEPPSLKKSRETMEGEVQKALSGGLTIELLKKSAKPKNTTGVLEIKLNDDLYKPSEAKARLILDHFGKCAYCETRFMDTAGGDVEHFRPKKGFNEYDRVSASGLGPKTKLGYFFLAYSWANHLWSCKECNEAYKKNYFGVMPDMSAPPERDDFGSEQDFQSAFDEWARAMTKHSDWTSGSTLTEESVLIDPSKENPRGHIQFDPQTGYAVGAQLDDKGKLVAPSHRGGATIYYLGLNRDELVFARARHLTLLRGIFVEMTRDLELVLNFLKWQRGDDWEDEAKKSRVVPRVTSHPSQGALKSHQDRFEEDVRKRGVTLDPFVTYHDVKLDPTDEPVPSDRRQPDPGPYFTKKGTVEIPAEHKIRDDPKWSPLDFLIYAVTPRAVFSALAADALAAWSLELAEHLVTPVEFVSQLDRPNTKSPSPNRATVSLFALDTHQAIMNFVARDTRVLQVLAEDHRIERAAFDAGSDAHGVCFVCRNILAEVIKKHAALQRMLKSRHTPEYDKAWEEHAHRLDELEKTFKLYKCVQKDWAPAMKVMNDNLDNYPPDLCHDLSPVLGALVKRHNALIQQAALGVNPMWYQSCSAIHQDVLRLIRALESRGAQQEPEYSQTVQLKRSLELAFNAFDFTGKLNALIGRQQWLMGNVGLRHVKDYETHHAKLTQEASDLEHSYQQLVQQIGLDIPDFTARLGEVKSGLTSFPPDPRFVQGTPQPQPLHVAPLAAPSPPSEIMEAGDEAPPEWVTPKATRVNSSTTYLGRGDEPAVYEQIRYSVVKG